MTRKDAEVLVERYKQSIIANVEPENVTHYTAEVIACLSIALAWTISDDTADRLTVLNMMGKTINGGQYAKMDN